MHEMSLAEGVLQILEECAQREHAKQVRLVRLEIGELAGVEVDALRFCFDVVTHGSVAEGALLEIVREPGGAWCMHCSRSVLIAQRGDPCPECGSHQLQVSSGTSMRVIDLEVT